MGGRLSAIGLLVVIMAGGGYATARYLLVVEKVSIEGSNSVLRAKAKKMMQTVLGKSFLAVNLYEQKHLVQSIPDVVRADIQRVLPDTLKVRLQTHRALARWADGGLIDVAGYHYDGVAGDLPIFSGDKTQIPAMIKFYDKIISVADSADIAQVELSASGNWSVFLQNGLVLYLGRDDPLERLMRYARYADGLRVRFPDMHAVDLRYESGFAVVNNSLELK